MERSHEELLSLLENNNLPVPEGTLTNLRYEMGTDDWHACTKEVGWYWWDSRDRAWKFAPLTATI